MKIRVNRVNYNIYVDIEKNQDISGKTSLSEKEIHLPVYGKKEFLKMVVIHELMHAYVFEYALIGNYYDFFEKSLEEERLCDIMAVYGEMILNQAELIFSYCLGCRNVKNK